MNDKNRKAFLDTIAYSEIGPLMLAASDDGYNLLVGSTQKKIITFDSYAAHPHKRQWLLNLKLWSTASGRYQIIWPTWNGLQKKLGLGSFSPDNQDRAAIELIRQRGALDDVDYGRFDEAIFKCRKEWASLPGANYGQHENVMGALQEVYVTAGGGLSA